MKSFLFALLVTSFTAHAFVGNVDSQGRMLKWDLTSPSLWTHTNVVNPRTRAIRFFLDEAAFSQANRAAELAAIRSAFAQWQAVPGTLLKFEDAGTVAGMVDVNTRDDRNVVFWSRKQSLLVNGETVNITGATAVSFWDIFDDNNTLAEADVAINGADYTWMTDFSNTVNQAQFVESVMLHEIGHFVGLDHSPIGAATMFVRGANGVNLQAGLSSDDISAARALYGQTSFSATFGKISGRVTKNGSGVFGAAVYAENPAGNVVAGTVTRAVGDYTLHTLPPGTYRVRVVPLDPNSATKLNRLVRGVDIDREYSIADTSFLPSADSTVIVAANATATLNVAVTSGTPAFRISQIRIPNSMPDVHAIIDAPVSVSLGQSNVVLGVFSQSLPTSNATFSITGDGLTVGATRFYANIQPGLHLMYATVSVSAAATPGLRTFVVTQGSNVAYAHGFLEILPSFPDFNFDSFDDRFQRQYFLPFTMAAAAPSADPDGDGFSNRFEKTTGTNPTNRLSAQFRIESVKLSRAGATIAFQSDAGRRFQLYGRATVPGSTWQAIGTAVTATGPRTEVVEAAATEFKFYKVQLLP